mmetsp:Transcript_44168/g.106702  ORF Transcript_44168/g.106702 Transcript_44168/m.106702 type:complete len:261 (+) Transcript_44168:159-941(+)
MGGKETPKPDAPPTPTRGRGASSRAPPAARQPAAGGGKKGGIQDTAVYGEIVQNLVGLHEMGREAAERDDREEEEQQGGIKDPQADAKSAGKQPKPPAAQGPTKAPKAPVAPPPAPESQPGGEAAKEGASVKRKSNGRAGKKNLTSECVAVLKEWYDQHTEWPYPTQHDKQELSKKVGMSEETVNNWFINARKRLMNRHEKERIIGAQSKRQKLQEEAAKENPPAQATPVPLPEPRPVAGANPSPQNGAQNGVVGGIKKD